MPKSLFLIFNHQFTATQEKDARVSLGVEKIVEMPDEIRELWGNLPPERPDLKGYLEPVRAWLIRNARVGDLVLIQGDFGACYLMVRFACGIGVEAIYSTTSRVAVEEHQPDGSVRMTHHFRHVRFRRYGL